MPDTSGIYAIQVPDGLVVETVAPIYFGETTASAIATCAITMKASRAGWPIRPRPAGLLISYFEMPFDQAVREYMQAC